MGILRTSNVIICGPSRVNNPIIRLLALYTGQEADIHLEGTVPPVSRFSAPPPLVSPMTIDMIVFEGHRRVATASSTKSKYCSPSQLSSKARRPRVGDGKISPHLFVSVGLPTAPGS